MLCIPSYFTMFKPIDRCMYRWTDRKTDCFAVSSLQLCSVLFSSMHFLLTEWCWILLPGLKQELLSSSYSLQCSTSTQIALGCSYMCYGEAGQATGEHLSPHHRNPYRSQTSDQTKCTRRLIVQHCLLIQQAQMVMVNLQKLQSIHNVMPDSLQKPKYMSTPLLFSGSKRPVILFMTGSMHHQSLMCHSIIEVQLADHVTGQ